MTTIEVHNAGEVDAADWITLQGIQRAAFDKTLTSSRSSEEIDFLVGMSDPVRYATSHRDPNTEVGGRFGPDQAYSKPRVAVAFEAHEPIGFMYAANNVSGATERSRNLKRLSVVKNYFWLREIAVHPDHQDQGVARHLAATLLRKANVLQRVTAYIWPGEPGMEGWSTTLEHYGFVSTGEQFVDLYGSGKKEVRQVRMQASNKHAILNQMPYGY